MLAIALIAAVFSGVAPVQAQSHTATTPHGRKLIGLVFDDSGSMRPRIQLPAFAAQLLVSSLDPTRDRLFTVRLSTWESAVKVAPINGIIRSVDDVRPETMERIRELHLPGLPLDEFDGRTPEAIIADIRKSWTDPHVDTPYTPDELMLDTLVHETGPDDEAHLVILTDGAIDGGRQPQKYIPDLAMVERNLAAYRSQLKGRLFVDYILIASKEDDESQTVARQGIRRALTETFNGTPDSPLYVVPNSDGLMNAVFDVISRVNATDRSLTLADNSIVQVSDDRLTVKSPISISRVVSVTFATKGIAPPRITATSFAEPPVLSLDSSMEKPDTQEGWRGERNSARTVQFRLATPLPSGTHTIDFDKPLGSKYLFLFDTLARYEVEIRGDKGAALRVGADNVPESVKGHAVQVFATLTDTIDGKDKDVELSAIPGAIATAWVEGRNGRIAVALQPDPANRRFVGSFQPDEVGQYTAGGSLVINGFVRREARRPTFRSIDGTVTPNMSLSAVDCTTCRPGELHTTWMPGEARVAIGELEIHMPPGRQIPFTLDLRGSPNWIAVTRADGTPVDVGKPIVAAEDGHLVLRVLRTAPQPDEPHNHDRPVSIRLIAASPYDGQTTRHATLYIDVPKPKLVYVGHSGDATQTGPLDLTLTDMKQGKSELHFELVGIPGLALDPSQIAVTTTSWTTQFPRPIISGTSITVKPALAGAWFECLACILGVPQQVVVHYRGIGEANSSAPMRFKPSWGDIFDSCGVWLLGFLIVLWLILAGLVYGRTPRFPKRSLAIIRRLNATLDAHEPLRRWDGEGNLRTLFGAMILTSLPARTHVEGLYLEASHGGLRLLLRGTTETIKINSRNQTIKVIREDLKTSEVIAIPWNSVFSDPRSFRSLTLSAGRRS